MNKLIIVCLSALVACSAAQDTTVAPPSTANPIKASIGLFQAPLKMCNPACHGICKARTRACVSVPNLINCAQSDATCKSVCDKTCVCINGCKAGCDKLNPCTADAKDGVGQMVCQAKQGACNTACIGYCPFQSIVGILNGIIVKFRASIQPKKA